MVISFVPVQFGARYFQRKLSIAFRASEDIEFALAFVLPVNSLDRTQFFGVDALKPIHVLFELSADCTAHE